MTTMTREDRKSPPTPWFFFGPRPQPPGREISTGLSVRKKIAGCLYKSCQQLIANSEPTLSIYIYPGKKEKKALRLFCRPTASGSKLDSGPEVCQWDIHDQPTAAELRWIAGEFPGLSCLAHDQRIGLSAFNTASSYFTVRMSPSTGAYVLAVFPDRGCITYIIYPMPSSVYPHKMVGSLGSIPFNGHRYHELGLYLSVLKPDTGNPQKAMAKKTSMAIHRVSTIKR